MRKSNKLNRKIKKLADGSIVEEAPGEEGGLGVNGGREDEDESSVDSLMAESPGKYDQKAREEAAKNGESAGPDQFKMINEEELIKKVTKKKIPKKKPAKVAPAPHAEENKPRPPRFTQVTNQAALKKNLSPPKSIPSKSPPPE